MNWNIFKRLRAVETDHGNTAASLAVMINRVYVDDGRIEQLVNSVTALNARIETQAGLLGTLMVDVVNYRKEATARLTDLEKSMNPAVIKAAAEKLTKAQAYRRDYYQKRKAAMAKLAELKRTTK